MTTERDGETTTIVNPDCLPTKELLKRQRKAEYEKAKAARKADKKREKAEAAAARTQARADRDAELWAALRKGDEIVPESK